MFSPEGSRVAFVRNVEGLNQVFLVELARAGHQPDSDATVTELLDQCVPVAGK